MNVYVEDKLTNISHDLKSGPYTFATWDFQSIVFLTYRNSDFRTDDFETVKKGVIISSKTRKSRYSLKWN
jgi:hypothetical protein